MDAKSPEDTNSRSISHEEGVVSAPWKNIFAELRYMLTTKDGWIGDYVRYSPFLPQKMVLTGPGLSLSDYAEHPAIEPEVQELQGTILWAERQSATAFDTSPWSATRTVHDRLDRVTTSRDSFRGVPFRIWDDRILSVDSVHHHGPCDCIASDTAAHH